MSKRSLLIVCCLLNCAGAPRQPRSVPFSVRAQIEVSSSGEVSGRPILPGDVVRSGESFTIKVDVDHPAHVYVVQYAADGWSTLLFPNEPGQRLAPGTGVVLPGGGRRYTLDQRAGEEVVYVVAARQPVLETDPELRARLRLPESVLPAAGQSRAASAPSPPPPPPPPPPVGRPPAERGGAREVKAGHVRIQADRSGTALLRFSFRHEP